MAYRCTGVAGYQAVVCSLLGRLAKSSVEVQDGARSQAAIQGPKQEIATRTLCSSLIG